MTKKTKTKHAKSPEASASCPVRDLSSPRVGVSASCPEQIQKSKWWCHKLMTYRETKKIKTFKALCCWNMKSWRCRT